MCTVTHDIPIYTYVYTYIYIYIYIHMYMRFPGWMENRPRPQSSSSSWRRPRFKRGGILSIEMPSARIAR